MDADRKVCNCIRSECGRTLNTRKFTTTACLYTYGPVAPHWSKELSVNAYIKVKARGLAEDERKQFYVLHHGSNNYVL